MNSASASLDVDATSLSLSKQRISSAGVCALASLLPGSNATSLDLSCTYVQLHAPRRASIPRDLSSFLVVVLLTGNPIDASGIRALCAVLPDTRLTALDLSNHALGGSAGAHALAAALPRAAALTTLLLGQNDVRATGAQALALVLGASSLTALHLGNCRLGVEGVCQLAHALVSSPRLLSLDISGSEVGVVGARALACALPASALTALHANNCALSGDGLAVLADALAHSRLAALHVRQSMGFDRTGAGLAPLVAVLAHARQLRTLDVSTNAMNAETACALASVLPECGLTELDLSGNLLGDSAMFALEQVLPRAPLTVLNVNAVEMTLLGVRMLAAALPLSQLTRLTLTRNRRVDPAKAATVLASCLAASRLTYVGLDGEHMLNEIPALVWRRAMAAAGGRWSEAGHAHMPRELRGVIVTLLVLARSRDARTRERSCGLADANAVALYLLFRWLGNLTWV